MRKLIVLIIEHSIVSRMEKYGEMTEFEKLCFHIEECLVARIRWAVLYKSVGHIPRKLKKQRRKEALKKEDEIKQIRLKINAMPIIPAGAAKEKVFEYLVNIYYLNRAEERADVQDTLVKMREAYGITKEALRESIIKKSEESNKSFFEELEDGKNKNE